MIAVPVADPDPRRGPGLCAPVDRDVLADLALPSPIFSSVGSSPMAAVLGRLAEHGVPDQVIPPDLDRPR